MKKILISWLVVAFLSWSGSAFAVQLLQLDISDGVYDFSTDTVVSTQPHFTLYALLNLNNNPPVGLDDIFYISMAVTPQVSDDADLGSFSFDGISYDVTDDMVYGTPQLMHYLKTFQHIVFSRPITLSILLGLTKLI